MAFLSLKKKNNHQKGAVNDGKDFWTSPFIERGMKMKSKNIPFKGAV